MTNKLSDTSNTQQNGEEVQNKQNSHSEQIITNEPIPNTPFRLIGTQYNYSIAIGMHRLTEPKESKEKALNELETQMWNIIGNMIVAVEETYKTVRELETSKQPTLGL
jgi:hypothetical protein